MLPEPLYRASDMSHTLLLPTNQKYSVQLSNRHRFDDLIMPCQWQISVRHHQVGSRMHGIFEENMMAFAKLGLENGI